MAGAKVVVLEELRVSGMNLTGAYQLGVFRVPRNRGYVLTLYLKLDKVPVSGVNLVADPSAVLSLTTKSEDGRTVTGTASAAAVAGGNIPDNPVPITVSIVNNDSGSIRVTEARAAILTL